MFPKQIMTPWSFRDHCPRFTGLLTLFHCCPWTISEGFSGAVPLSPKINIQEIPEMRSVHQGGEYGNALQAAAYMGHEAVFRLLLEKGCNFVWTDKQRSEVCYKNVLCDGCEVAPIRGIRYKCKFCGNYDLCNCCFQKKEEIHDEHHMFLELPLNFAVELKNVL